MNTTLLVFIIVVLVALLIYVLYAFWAFRRRFKDVADAQNEVDRLEKLAAEHSEVEAELATSRKKFEAFKPLVTQLEIKEQLSTEISAKKNELATVESKIRTVTLDVSSQEFGIYEPVYDFGNSERYKAEIAEIRKRQKQLIKDGEAATTNTKWQVSGSEAKGRKMINEQFKLMLRAFNGDCDSIIAKVKYNNVDRIQQRIRKSFDAINKLGKSKDAELHMNYLNLKIDELRLVHEYQEKVQAEREEQRAIREQMREEEKARREIEKARIEAEKEEKRYQKALEDARKEMEKATGEEQDAFREQIELLLKQLEEAHERGERAMSRAQMTRSGHVYIISNIGSFGEDVYKIGMTRRLEPMDRVKELGDASVPFSFDVHAIIYADDAPGLEKELHRKFDDKRVNKVNLRKEYFKVSLEDIQSAVIAERGEIDFTLVAEAPEYRETKVMMAAAH